MFDETNLLFSPLKPSNSVNINSQGKSKQQQQKQHEGFIEDFSSARGVEALVALLKKENISLKVAVATYKKAAAGTPEQLHHELIRLQESEAQMSSENARLKATVRELQLLSNKENTSASDIYEQEMMRYQLEITRLESLLESANAQGAQNERLETEINRLESEVLQSKLEADRLKSQLDTQRGESDQKAHYEINELRSKLSDSEREISALTAELESSRHNNSKLSSKLDTTESQLQEKIRQLESELESSRRHNGSLNKTLDSNTSQLQEKIRHLETQNNSLKSEQRHLTTALEAARKENDKLSSRVSSMRNDLDTFKLKLDLETKMNKEHEARLQGKNSEIERLRSQLNQQTLQENSSLPLVNEINCLHDEINDLKIRLKAGEHEIQQLTKNAQSFERDSDNQKGKLLLLQQENKRLSDECSRLHREVNDKSSTNIEHQHELLNQIELLESRNRDLQRNLELAQHNQRWNEKTNEVESKLLDSESKLLSLQSEKANLQDIINELESRCEFYETEYDKLKETMDHSRQSQFTRDTHVSIEEDLRRHRELEAQLRANHETEKARMQDQIRNIRLKLEEAEFTVEQLQREKRQKQAEIDDLVRDVNRFQQSNVEASRLTGTGIPLSVLLEQELAKTKLDSSERDKRQLELDLEDLQRKFKQTLSSENWEKEDLRQRLKKMASERIELEGQLQKIEREREGDKSKITLQKIELEELKEQAETAKEKYERLKREQKESGETTASLKSKLRRMETKTQELETKIVTGESKISQLTLNQTKDLQYIEKLKQKVIELKQRELDLRAHVTELVTTSSFLDTNNNKNNTEAIYYKAQYRDALIHYADCLTMYNFISQEFETFDSWFKKRTIKFGLNNSLLVQVKKPLTFATVAKFVLATVRWQRRAQESRQRKLKLIELKTQLEIQD
ncbi:uncharacterized protein KQ657_003409 [Scheffersomyces spartinae]|uniref:Uncharacterized protein n=1 Tax=Scheffersomyces spartinae TaxID=45513 RepID=A0A9P7VDD6_9ASCO|nr:uncharacterized protein KQ657_003409 [Scheffersomyces spartinae]KAG7195642.1 hypothetical protein KQ657_003409 [Scheffersomyces spartinae]